MEIWLALSKLQPTRAEAESPEEQADESAFNALRASEKFQNVFCVASQRAKRPQSSYMRGDCVRGWVNRIGQGCKRKARGAWSVHVHVWGST